MREFILIFVLIPLIKTELLPFLKPCPKSSKDLNKCLKENIESAKPYLAEGVPDISIPSFKEIPIPYTYLDLPGFHYGIWKYVITGMEAFDVREVQADFKSNEIEIEAFVPIAFGAGLAQIKGNLFNTSWDSMGPVISNLSNLIVTYKLKISIVERDGIEFMVRQSDEMKLEQTDGDFHVHFDNLKFGNETATEMMNDVLNSNKQQFLEILLPILKKTLTELLNSVADALFKVYSFHELFP